MTRRVKLRNLVKAVVFIAALFPLSWLVWSFQQGTLSANPLSDITNETGVWTLRFIVLTIAVTPFRRITGIHEAARYRRMFGLYAFFYGSLHLMTYLWFDKFFDLNDILLDIPKRPFITVGFTAFTLMIPLALTSTKNMIRRLGGRKWNLLHRLVYITAICGAIHYLWLVKVVTPPQIIYAAIIAVLLGYRVAAAAVAARKKLPAR
jgi:methionine sulfoxide reductase heme-binding subunit